MFYFERKSCYAVKGYVIVSIFVSSIFILLLMTEILYSGRKALYIILGLAVGGFLILAGIGLWKKGHLRQSFGKSLKGK